jgi:spore coat protein CotH
MWWLLLACQGAKESSPTETGKPNQDDSQKEPESIPIIDDSEPPDSPEDTAATHAENLAAYEDLYDPDIIHTIELLLDDVAVAALEESPEEYVEGGIVFDGKVTFEKVGIRLKGNVEENTLETGKPSFKVRLNEYESGQHIGKVTRLTLNSMNSDPTQVREVLACLAWSKAGMMSPQADFTTVSYTVNGTNIPLGLYTNVETVDSNFIEHQSLDTEGALWEATDSTDFTSSGVDHFDLVSGEGWEAELDNAWETIWSPTEDFYTTADTVLQMDLFLLYWAWQVVTGNADGYPYELDDFYLYGDPTLSGRYAFAPWDMEKSWDTGMEWDQPSGVAAIKCAYDDICMLKLETALSEALTAYDSINPEALAADLFALTDTAVGNDPRSQYTYIEVDSARATFQYRLSLWSDRVRQLTGVH